MKLILKLVLYGFVGYVLYTAGATTITWQYWAVILSLLAMDIVSGSTTY